MRLRTESIKRCADDGRTKHTYIHTPYYCRHCCTVYVGLAQARPNKSIASITMLKLLIVEAVESVVEAVVVGVDAKSVVVEAVDCC